MRDVILLRIVTINLIIDQGDGQREDLVTERGVDAREGIPRKEDLAGLPVSLQEEVTRDVSQVSGLGGGERGGCVVGLRAGGVHQRVPVLPGGGEGSTLFYL